jgi:hypothetical protein
LPLSQYQTQRMGVEAAEEEEEILQGEEVVLQEEEAAPRPSNRWPLRCNKQPKEEEGWMDTHQISLTDP